jgi:hypothetical protein
MNRAIGRGSLVVSLLGIALGAPAAAGAVEQEGRGEAIKHVKNIEFPNIRQEGTKNGGTDLEFAVITVKAAESSPPVVTPPRKVQPPAKANKPKKAKKACKKPKKGASKKAKAKFKKCQKAAKRQNARKSDADAATPGVQKRFAFVGSYGDGLQIMDVTDPAASERVATWDCGVAQGDVQVFRRDDLGGRWFVAYTHDTGYTMQLESQCVADLKAMGVDVAATKGYGTYIADVTDPYNPRTVSYFEVKQGSHNGTVHPSGRFFYNSNSDLITSPVPAIELTDITDITKPKPAGEFALKTFPGLGTEAHDVNFSKDGSRAYVAALSHGEVLDTTDPGAPKFVGFVTDPALQVWHETDEITVGERKFLVAEDEFAGATGTGQCPNGGVHVYDITGPLEAAPVKIGAWNINDVGPTEDGVGGRCTAHVFQIHDDTDLMTIAYYNGGVRVVDMAALEGVALGATGIGMKQLGWFRFKDSDTWAVKAPLETVDRKGFYMFGNDHARGFDVYRYEPSATVRSPGEWLTPERAFARARQLKAAGGVAGGICILPANR